MALTTSGGRWGLWDIRLVDGQVTREPLVEAHAPAVNSPAGEDLAVSRPVRSPER